MNNIKEKGREKKGEHEGMEVEGVKGPGAFETVAKELSEDPHEDERFHSFYDTEKRQGTIV